MPESRPPASFRSSHLHGFHDLMRHRVMDILLVASPYDSYLLEEAGELSEREQGEFRNLDLHYAPGLTTASTAAEALRLLETRRFELVIATPHVADMDAVELARSVRTAAPDLPVVLLAYDLRELQSFAARRDTSVLDRMFLWQGDARILLGIVKHVEDRLNVAHDTASVGVQVILLVEDNVRYYSSFLPVIYGELLHQSQRLLSEGANLSQKITRMRARPKILLCGTFEEAWEAFTAYRDDVLGLISDVEFPRGGERSDGAGLELVSGVRAAYPDIPVLLQSFRPENEARAREAGADFVLKGSPRLLQELRRFMTEYLGFGDFVFRLPDGREVARAEDLRALEECLRTVPEESIAYHAERNHFSKWLKARTEFTLAQELRPRTLSDFADVEDLRRTLIRAISEYRRDRMQSAVADYERGGDGDSGDFQRIGGGSLGGKARGLAFMRLLLAESRAAREFTAVRVAVPPAVVLGTDVFDRFLDQNGLRDFALQADDDAEVLARFRAAALPEDIRDDLAAFLERMGEPLAVRSSSLLEDSQYHPFTGVYDTYMLPNDHPFLPVRLEQLVDAVKRLYAGTFSRRAKAYMRATPYRLEEEKMAVILQRIAGAAHGRRFYPDFAGVARSHNFYPTGPMKAADGIAAVAFGLGRTVVDGERCLRFSPRYPRHLVEFSTVAEMVRNSQRSFWALDLAAPADTRDPMLREARFDLQAAEADGTLAAVASTFSPENQSVSDGVSRAGVRLVSFAPVLKHGLFPLPEVLQELLALGEWGLGGPVEVEFAVTLSVPRGAPCEFAFLQLRPLAMSREPEELQVGAVAGERLLCRSRNVLGHGRLDGIRDVVVVDRDRFERAQSAQVARELAVFNGELTARGEPYVLVGVGRWGSADPWLGIPVTWDQISGARVIVEAGFRDADVAPSQGTHFFQNLTSFNVGYFTVGRAAGDGAVDWDWLAAQPAVRETGCVRHLRLASPLVVAIDGKTGEGVILKPE